MSFDPPTASPSLAPERAGDCVLPLSEVVCAGLVAQHGPMVKAACHRILGDAVLAEDVTQEVFLRLVRKLPALPPQTILGGWLYVAACHLARTHLRAHTRRSLREHRPEAVEHLMQPAQDTLWRELEPLLDDAMLTLSERQRELVLARYFQRHTQRVAATLAGCSESVASRELAAAIERLRRYFSRRGVTISGTALAGLLATHAAQASMGVTTLAGTLSSASALAGAATAGTPLLLAIMKTTTTTKLFVAATALVIALGAVHQFTQGKVPAIHPGAGDSLARLRARDGVSPGESNRGGATHTAYSSAVRSSSGPAEASPVPVRDEAALKVARDKATRFMARMGQLALMNDAVKVQELLLSEYGIRLSVEEIRKLQQRGPKGFTFGVPELWATQQPLDALAWVASVVSDSGGGGDIHQLFLGAAMKALSNPDRDALAAMLPEGPGKAKILDLLEGSTNPASLANRILSETDPAERAARLRLLAQGWSDSVTSVEWARQNLTGADKTAFYSQAGYNLAHQNPDAALQMLAELKGTEAYASTFELMMRGLVQEGGKGAQAAELIAKAEVSPGERAELLSELSRRWARQDTEAAIAWVNTLTAPEDFRAAIPLLVSQLDRERISQTVSATLKNPDPVMELALIEAAAPPGLYFDSEKSRLILDPIIAKDPQLKLAASEGNTTSREALLWDSVNKTATREAESRSPAIAMDWLAKLPFASQSDYAQVAGAVMNVWNLKSPVEASAWLQNSALDPALKAGLLKPAKP